MKRMTTRKAERIVRRLSPLKFLKEKSARELDISSFTHMNMLEMRGGVRIIGWAYASDVQQRDMCEYVCMFENEDGFQLWSHVSSFLFTCCAERVCEKVTNNK